MGHSWSQQPLYCPEPREDEDDDGGFLAPVVQDLSPLFMKDKEQEVGERSFERFNST